jgi:hypothetical protein
MHFTFGSMIQHRPKQEVCIYAWYDVEADEWSINQLEDHLNDERRLHDCRRSYGSIRTPL